MTGFGQGGQGGQGGGFGQGGHGGGFGQGGHGGGFGQGGQGGGFGHGGGFGQGGHGGGFGQGGRGEEPPLARIPFTADEHADLTAMARYARAAGVAAVVAGVMQLGSTVLSGSQAGFLPIAVAIALAALLFRAAKLVDKVVTTDEADQTHLVGALRALRDYFMVKSILALLAVLAGCCLVMLLGAFIGMLASGAR